MVSETRLLTDATPVNLLRSANCSARQKVKFAVPRRPRRPADHPTNPASSSSDRFPLKHGATSAYEKIQRTTTCSTGHIPWRMLP
jgi:hypothetical protein